MTEPTPPAPSPTQSRTPDTVFSAILLASTGGLLDAVVYLNHGHVFANAMTGNAILLGIAALQHDRTQILGHAIPIAAFTLGVSASRILRATRSRYVALAALGLEGIALFAIGLLPDSFPGLPLIAMISFVSALQVATFRKVGRFTYNSTFITGNLRDMVDGLFGQIDCTPEDRQRDLAKCRKLAAICLFFICGALLGAWAAPRYGNRAFWLAEPLLLTAASRTAYWQRKKA